MSLQLLQQFLTIHKMASVWSRVLSRVGDVLSLASLLVLALHVKWLPLRASANEASEKRVAATTTVRASTAMLLLASALCEGAFMFDRSKTAFKTTFDVFRDLVEADKTADFADSLRSFMNVEAKKYAFKSKTHKSDGLGNWTKMDDDDDDDI